MTTVESVLGMAASSIVCGTLLVVVFRWLWRRGPSYWWYRVRWRRQRRASVTDPFRGLRISAVKEQIVTRIGEYRYEIKIQNVGDVAVKGVLLKVRFWVDRETPVFLECKNKGVNSANMRANPGGTVVATVTCGRFLGRVRCRDFELCREYWRDLYND